VYALNEYYRRGRSFAKVTRHVGTFSTREEAERAADLALTEQRRVPESEGVFFGVLELNEARLWTEGKLVYSAPADPFNDSSRA
jgi:hypothetical protein